MHAEEFARETVMETLLLSAWEADALLFLNFGATTVPWQKARVSTYTLVISGMVTIRYFIYDKVL